MEGLTEQLPSVLMRPVAVTLDTIERELGRGRAVGNYAGYEKLRGGVFVVRFGR